MFRIKTLSMKTLIVFAAVAGVMFQAPRLLAQEQQAGKNGDATATRQPANADQPKRDSAKPPEKAAARRAVTATLAKQKKKTGVPKPTVVLKPGESPKIAFETPVLNFGRLRAGSEVRHDYWFKNTGTGPLEILAVKPGCGCTTAGQHDRIIQPGERGKVPIKMNTSRMSGAVKKTVVVTTNSAGGDARVILRIEGEVWQIIKVAPRSAGFGRVSLDSLEKETPIRKLTIVNNMDDPVTLTNVRSTNPVFHGEVATIEAGKKFELTITMSAAVASGSTKGYIQIDTGLKEKPTLKVQATAYITAAIEVVPPRLTLSDGPTTAMKRNLYVTNTTKTPITLGDVQVSNPALKAVVQETRPGKTFRITLDIPAGYVVPAGGDQIIVTTSHAKMPTLTIPIVARKFVQTAKRSNPATVRQPTAVKKAGSKTTQTGAKPITTTGDTGKAGEAGFD